MDNLFERLSLKSLFGLIFAALLINSGFALGVRFFKLGLENGLLSQIIQLSIYGIATVWIIVELWKATQSENRAERFDKLIGAITREHYREGIKSIIINYLFGTAAAIFAAYIYDSLYPGALDRLLKSLLTTNQTNATNAYYDIRFILVGLFIPITEEVVFRGMLLRRIAAKWNMTGAILVTSILYSMTHINIMNSLVFGILLALLYVKSNNILIPIAVHSVNNMVIEYTDLPDNSSYYLGGQGVAEILELHKYGAIIVPCFVILSCYTLYYMKKNWPKGNAIGEQQNVKVAEI